MLKHPTGIMSDIQSTSEDPNIEKLYRLATRWSEALDRHLLESSSTREIDYTIAQIREVYQDLIFADFENAIDREIDSQLWTKHHKVIELYRAHIHRLDKDAGRKYPVELRKTVQSFVAFIKATTKFYRTFIQRLASEYSVAELAYVVEQFKLEYNPPDNPIFCSPKAKELIIRSCQRHLVNLGDLSRYREIASPTEKNWAPATGYYDLAKRLLPQSGTPHNQLAVISISDGSNFSATYHLYRAVSVQEPFPAGGNNLRVGFQKILKAYKAGKLGKRFVRKEENMVSELLGLFVRLHAMLFEGYEITETHETLQAEMLAQLTQDLKERLLSEGILNKLALINISAEAFAATPQGSRKDKLQAVPNFLRLNVETFNTLLLVFQPELERVSTNKSVGPTSGSNTNSAECISAVGRRMLPALRLYSKWLLVSHQKLQNTLDDTALAVQTKQFWQTYANTLSLLAATFDVESLPKPEYMLGEDEDIIGFLPLNGAATTGHQPELGYSKHDKDSPYRSHPNEEQLFRVRTLVEDGLTLCTAPSVPIAVVDGTIIYQEDGMSSAPAGLESLHRPAATVQFSDMEPALLTVAPNRYRAASMLVGLGGGSVIGSIAPSETASVKARMNKMVDSIVGPKEEAVSEEDEHELEQLRKAELQEQKPQHTETRVGIPDKMNAPFQQPAPLDQLPPEHNLRNIWGKDSVTMEQATMENPVVNSPFEESPVEENPAKEDDDDEETIVFTGRKGRNRNSMVLESTTAKKAKTSATQSDILDEPIASANKEQEKLSPLQLNKYKLDSKANSQTASKVPSGSHPHQGTGIRTLRSTPGSGSLRDAMALQQVESNPPPPVPPLPLETASQDNPPAITIRKSEPVLATYNPEIAHNYMVQQSKKYQAAQKALQKSNEQLSYSQSMARKQHGRAPSFSAVLPCTSQAVRASRSQGTYTAKDVVNQMHSYGHKKNPPVTATDLVNQMHSYGHRKHASMTAKDLVDQVQSYGHRQSASMSYPTSTAVETMATLGLQSQGTIQPLPSLGGDMASIQPHPPSFGGEMGSIEVIPTSTNDSVNFMGTVGGGHGQVHYHGHAPPPQQQQQLPAMATLPTAMELYIEHQKQQQQQQVSEKVQLPTGMELLAEQQQQQQQQQVQLQQQVQPQQLPQNIWEQEGNVGPKTPLVQPSYGLSSDDVGGSGNGNGSGAPHTFG